ncbi:MAG: hypothetical protein GY803_31070, partial [Chloroflexi bacterium]|nr:hypothetical protein [Chloroflexota bacterium]
LSIMPLSKYKPQAKHLRRVFRRAAAAVRYRQSLKGVPALFANSFPKSGTHLLTQILHGFTQLGPAVASGLPAVVMFDGPTGQPRPTSTVLSDLSKLQPGDISYGHLHATPEIVGGLTRDGIAPFFILRDPRDVVVSHVHYVTEMEPNHVHHSFYKNELKDFEARLEVSILGRPELDVPF